MSAESVTHIREDNSRSREAARQNLSAESISHIREDNSRSREAARQNLSAESVTTFLQKTNLRDYADQMTFCCKNK